MENTKAKSTIPTAIVLLLLVALASFGVYKFATTSDLFDSSGDYVKNTAAKGDVEMFMRACENINYDTLVKDYKDYLGKPIMYWAYIEGRSDNFGGGVEYIVNIPMKDKKVRVAKIKALFKTEYNRGDYVQIYGTLSDLIKYKDATVIPYIEARKFVLKVEEDDEEAQ